MTAYVMRISDWSSDVCSSDLLLRVVKAGGQRRNRTRFAEQLCLDTFEPDSLDPRCCAFEVMRVLAVELDEGGAMFQRFLFGFDQIGRASCRERVCQYG